MYDTWRSALGVLQFCVHGACMTCFVLVRHTLSRHALGCLWENGRFSCAPPPMAIYIYISSNFDLHVLSIGIQCCVVF